MESNHDLCAHIASLHSHEEMSVGLNIGMAKDLTILHFNELI